MKHQTLILTVSFLALCIAPVSGYARTAPAEGSHVYEFPTDTLMRGYCNRPYERYEAEPDRCQTNGTFLAASEDQRTLQSEASHQQALQLTAKDDYVAWVVNRAGDGLTVRFSLPDNEQGTGTTGSLAVYAGEEQVGALALSSYWAWQYCTDTYPDNTPKTNCIIRMKFDETHLRLSRSVEVGETLRLVKTDNNAPPYTIDFVELEPVPAPVRYEDIAGDKVQYTGGSLLDFINANTGKTIYIPEGRWECDKRLYINKDNTSLIGAGEWYTEIFFSAPSDNAATYSQRGIEVSGISFSAAKGNGTYCNILFDNVSRPVGAYNSQWAWTESGNCATALPVVPNLPEGDAHIYGLMGRPCGTLAQGYSRLHTGIYIVSSEQGTYKIFIP